MQHHWLSLPTGTIEISDRVNREGWEVCEKAEEGSVGSSTIDVADIEMTLEPEGLRLYTILEDESESDDDVIFSGLVSGESLSRGTDDHFEPAARSWSLTLDDANGYWNRRVMVGTDCNRSAENDTSRLAWLLTTSEADWINDAASFVSSAGPVAMDAVDYRGQYLNQIADDGAQASGKNWWVQRQNRGTGRNLCAWYGKDSLTAYSSDLLLSNDPTDMDADAIADGTSLVWPISEDTKLNKDPSRRYSGVYGTSGRSIYRRNPGVNTVGHPLYHVYRDFVVAYPNVKTKEKAIARADRLLADLAVEDERIATIVVLPVGKATMLRAGMRVQFRATHLSGYRDEFRWVRVLSCTVSPISAGRQYKLALELQGPGSPASATEHGTRGGIMWLANDNLGSSTTAWNVDWLAEGDSPPSGYVYTPLPASFAYHTSGGYTDGFEVVATSGTLDLHTVFSCIWAHTEATDTTFVGSIRVNGSVVASQTVVVVYNGWGNDTPSFDFTAPGVAVVAGDVITVHLTASPALPGSFTIPWGTGQGTLFEILNTSVVVP